MEMFQDVARASHRWLMTHTGDECDAYRLEQSIVVRWMSKHKLPHGYRADESNP